jgi:hypothetical protein
VRYYRDGATFEVEFVMAGGRTIALFTLTLVDIRSINGRKVLHVRELAQVAT